MTWFKVDDGFCFHPKAVSAGNSAIGLWVRAGSWAAQQLTDGLVPRHMLPALGGRPSDAARLVASGLWIVSDEGWLFHDWELYQPTRDETMDKRAKRAEAGRIGGLRSGESRRSKDEASCFDDASAQAKQTRTPTRPVPSRPVVGSSSSPSSPSVTRANGRGGMPNDPKGTDGHPQHPHHPNALALLDRIRGERALPLTTDALLAWAYRLGAGDPWAGQRLVVQATEKSLEGADDPKRVVLSRLRKAGDAGAEVIQLSDVVKEIS